MKYTITLHNDWSEPYWQHSDKNTPKDLCRHISDDKYEVEGLDFCKEVLKDFLDAPVAEMTLEQVKKEFEEPRIGPISQERLQAIANYYNGRLKLQKEIFSQLDALGDKPHIFKFDIPMEYNYFACYADDDDEHMTKQNSAWLEVVVQNVSKF